MTWSTLGLRIVRSDTNLTIGHPTQNKLAASRGDPFPYLGRLAVSGVRFEEIKDRVIREVSECGAHCILLCKIAEGVAILRDMQPVRI